jgi:predicted nucleic acid-binding Zn ribbon protein
MISGVPEARGRPLHEPACSTVSRVLDSGLRADRMERIGDTLGKAVRRLDRPEATFAWIESAWPRIVGHSLAAHTRPSRCRDGCLEIAADARLWADEVDALEEQLRARINEAWGRALVRQVKTLVPRNPEQPKDSDNRHTPFVRRSRA